MKLDPSTGTLSAAATADVIELQIISPEPVAQRTMRASISDGRLKFQLNPVAEPNANSAIGPTESPLEKASRTALVAGSFHPEVQVLPVQPEDVVRLQRLSWLLVAGLLLVCFSLVAAVLVEWFHGGQNVVLDAFGDISLSFSHY